MEDASFWFQHRNECIVAAIRRSPPDGAIMDIGGGNGYVTKRLIRQGFQAILLEPGPVGAWNAKMQRAVPDVVCATLEDARFEPGSLAGIGLFDVLEHIESDREFVHRVHTILRMGGMLYLTVPAHSWLWSFADVAAGHYRRYNPQMLQELLEEKFEILYLTHFFKALVLPVLLLRAIPFKIGLARKRNLLDSDAEHGAGGGAAWFVLSRLLRKEPRKINRGVSLSTGTSCLVVAKKRARKGVT